LEPEASGCHGASASFMSGQSVDRVVKPRLEGHEHRGGEMNVIYRLMTAVGIVLLLAGTGTAQTTSKATEMGTAQFSVAQISGEVVMVDGNYLLVKIRPSGVQRWFNVSPDRQF